MWDDPLDELIGLLERKAVDTRARDDLPPIEDLNHVTDVVLYGRDFERERLPEEPAYQRWMAYAAQVRARRPIAAPDGGCTVRSSVARPDAHGYQ